MKNELPLTVIITMICFAVSFAQETTLYLPGTGDTVKELTFENPDQLTEAFDYCAGWAGTGFGLSGTQRGAPEVVNVIENPENVDSSGDQVLAFHSQVRDDAWHAEHSSECPESIYGGPDDNSLGGGNQDDLFMYGDHWEASETPSVMMHVYIPSDFPSNGVTSLRMPISLTYQGNVINSYPAIWCYGDVFAIRAPRVDEEDIFMDTNAPNGGLGTWWTFGISYYSRWRYSVLRHTFLCHEFNP